MVCAPSRTHLPSLRRSRDEWHSRTSIFQAGLSREETRFTAWRMPNYFCGEGKAGAGGAS